MNLFDHVKKWPENPGLQLFIELKYGKVAPTKEFTDKLPLPVVKLACEQLYEMTDLGNHPEEILRDNLRVILQRPYNVEQMKSILFKYHTLLGTM